MIPSRSFRVGADGEVSLFPGRAVAGWVCADCFLPAPVLGKLAEASRDACSLHGEGAPLLSANSHGCGLAGLGSAGLASDDPPAHSRVSGLVLRS